MMHGPISQTPHQIAKDIIKWICEKYGVQFWTIKYAQSGPAIKARGHISHALRDYMGLTYVSIGKHLNKHCSTVSRARKAHIARMAKGDFIAIDITQFLPKRGGDMAKITLEQLKSCKNMNEAVIEFFQKEIGEEAELTAQLCERIDNLCFPSLWVAEKLLDNYHYSLFRKVYNEASAIFCDATKLQAERYFDVTRALNKQYFDGKEKAAKIFRFWEDQEYIEAREAFAKAQEIHCPASNAVVFPEIVRLYNAQAEAA